MKMRSPALNCAAERYPVQRDRVRPVVGDHKIAATDGMHDFHKLWSNCFDNTVRLCVLDLLELNGEDYRAKPLAEHKKRLARLLARPRDGIEYVEHLKALGGASSNTSQAWIGRIVSKRLDMRDRPSPSKSWLKVKNPKYPAMMRIQEASERERKG